MNSSLVQSGSPADATRDGTRQLEATLRRESISLIQTQLGELAQHFPTFSAEPGEADESIFNPLVGLAHDIADTASAAGLTRVARFARALEALFKVMHEMPSKRTQSAFRTVAQALEILPSLADDSTAEREPDGLAPLILVLDDVAVSRKVICSALERVQMRAVSVADPRTAMELFEHNRFDLVFLDIGLPGVDGFEVCEKLRATKANASTPAVFVSAFGDYQTHLRSIESGAIDIMAKPVLLQELALKAIIHLHRSRTA